MKVAKKSCKHFDFDNSEDDQVSATDESDTDEPDQDTDFHCHGCTEGSGIWNISSILVA